MSNVLLHMPKTIREATKLLNVRIKVSITRTKIRNSIVEIRLSKNKAEKHLFMLANRTICSNLAVASLIEGLHPSHPMQNIPASPSTFVQTESPVIQLRLSGLIYVFVFQCLIMALPVLKWIGVSPISHWSWLWVLAPMWMPGALLAVVIGIEEGVKVIRLSKISKKQHLTDHLVCMHSMSALLMVQQS
jgi:hypothetical protein